MHLLTIGHSYVIAANRRLAHEMAVQGRGRWEVTAVAPAHLAADLRPVTLEPIAGEACTVEALELRLARIPHLRRYDRRLRSLLNRPWDVVHVWEEPYVAACAQVTAAAPKRAKVVPATFQNLVKRYPFPLGRFESRVMTRADAWIPFGHTIFDAQGAKPLYAAKPSRIIPPGVDVQRMRFDADARRRVRTTCGWQDAVPVVGYLGRFVPEKGLRTLLRALELTHEPWRALFVGGGPLQPELTAFADAHPGRVHVATGVTHDDVPAYLSAMDVLCAPSETTATWREQFGRMLIEAMACGVPVIASRSGEIPHVVADAGIVVPERDADAWTRALDGLLGAPERRRELAAAGLSRAHQCYALPSVARAHLRFFEELL
jgi:glycosyltransferase involved in cell wall biosynthesis